MFRRTLARAILAFIDLTGLGELIRYLLNRRLIARRSVVDTQGRRLDIDTYEVTETTVVKRGVLCFRQTVLSTYEESRGVRTLIKQSVLAEEQIPCPE